MYQQAAFDTAYSIGLHRPADDNSLEGMRGILNVFRCSFQRIQCCCFSCTMQLSNDLPCSRELAMVQQDQLCQTAASMCASAESWCMVHGHGLFWAGDGAISTANPHQSGTWCFAAGYSRHCMLLLLHAPAARLGCQWKPFAC